MTEEITSSHPWEERFRAQMEDLRSARQITQTALAEQVRERGFPFHQQTIAKIENGTRPVRLDEAYVIADVLGSSVPQMVLPLKQARDLQRLTDAWRTASRLRYAVLRAAAEYDSARQELAKEIRYLERTAADDETLMRIETAKPLVGLSVEEIVEEALAHPEIALRDTFGVGRIQGVGHGEHPEA